jgi:peptidoglycan hydrolase-like protein with peptidoglycan-binding domain
MLTISATDVNGTTASATQTITVLPPPSISVSNAASTVMPGTAYTFTVVPTGFTNPSYVVGDYFSGSSVTNTNINSSGVFTWTPDQSQNGDHTINVFASDSLGHSAQTSVSVRVGSGPTLTVPANVTTSNITPGQTVSFTLVPNGYSPTAFSVSEKFNGPGVSTLNSGNINTSGFFSWSPQAADAGTHVITFMGQVGAYGPLATTTQTITVVGANGVVPGVPATVTTSSNVASGMTLSDLQAKLAQLQSQAGASNAGGVSSNFIFTLALKQGSESDEVMELQKLLQKLGYLTVAPNGYFGPSTKSAVMKFQTAHGLDALGTVGPATRVALNSITAGATQTPSTDTTLASGAFVFEHFMGPGDDDTPDVMELQKKLVTLGFLKATPNGFYGTATEAAVKKFQSAHGLATTGYVGSNTRSALNAQ